MAIIEQLKKEDRRLRGLAMIILGGMLVLAAGLWRLQVVAAQRYTRSEEAQSVRLVRIPAVRGKILDRNGVPLADNRPSYDINLYLEELRPWFRHEYTNRFVPAYRAEHGGARPRGQVDARIQEASRLSAYTNVVQAVSYALGEPIELSADRFVKHYHQALALPLPVKENLNPSQMALFFERCLGLPGIDLEVQAVRTYPFGAVAAHTLGHLRRSDEADTDPEPLVFRYRLRDYAGVAGIEGKFDDILRGRAGVKALRVNSQGYRHEESVLQPTEPGETVRLSLDLEIQQVAERALRDVDGADTRGAVVVMDVRNGELLALASAPDFDPNAFLGGMSHDEFARLNDPKMAPQMNRAVSGQYAPGSIFKIVVGLAAMEAGVLDPARQHEYHGYWMVGRRRIQDEAAAGLYDFKRAFKKSSNSYFIDHGLKTGRARIVSMARRLGFGERTGLALGAESEGFLPDDEFLARKRERGGGGWSEGDTANLCIGQGALYASPIQVAVMVAAIANGGKVLQPRIVLGVEDSEGNVTRENPIITRYDAQLNPRHAQVVRAAMLADVEEAEGTGREAFVPGFRVCGKTGTAEVKKGRHLVDKITWFAAFAPYESPRYAVVVVVESGASGGRTSAPVAKKVFQALQARELQAAGRMASGGFPRGEAGGRASAQSGRLAAEEGAG